MGMCRYLVADGRHCNEEAGEQDLCRWHDPKGDHHSPGTAEALEHYVRQGGLCHGLQLARAELAGLNLVNKGRRKAFCWSSATSIAPTCVAPTSTASGSRAAA